MSAAEFTEQRRTECGSHLSEDVEVVMQYHQGDHVAAIKTLLGDIIELKRLLALSSGAMSSGFTRGWKPLLDEIGAQATQLRHAD